MRNPDDRRRWLSWLFPSLWLVYVAQAGAGVLRYSTGWAAAAGFAIIAAFVWSYLLGLHAGWAGRYRRYWSLLAASVVLMALESFFARQDALVFAIYIAVLAVASGRRIAVALVAALAGAVLLVPRLVPGWGGRLDWNDALTVLLVSAAVWGVFGMVRSNRALTEARAEVARLAAENERSRIARDLHDLLGHSLTTITVKAGLAGRLFERDPERAAVEIAEVEALSRRSLADVRAAVAGYRDLTLAGELATGRAVLQAAGIAAEFPSAVDVVAP